MYTYTSECERGRKSCRRRRRITAYAPQPWWTARGWRPSGAPLQTGDSRAGRRASLVTKYLNRIPGVAATQQPSRRAGRHHRLLARRRKRKTHTEGDASAAANDTGEKQQRGDPPSHQAGEKEVKLQKMNNKGESEGMRLCNNCSGQDGPTTRGAISIANEADLDPPGRAHRRGNLICTVCSESTQPEYK